MEPFALADTPAPSRDEVPLAATRSRRTVAIAVGLAVVLVAGLLVALRWWGPAEQSARLGGLPSPTEPVDDTRESRAAGLLEALQSDLMRGRPSRTAALAGGDRAAARELRDLTRAVAKVDLKVLDLRFVALEGGEEPGRDFTVGADLTWQVRGFDPQPSSVEVPLTLRDEGDAVTFVTSRADAAESAPIWFNDSVQVQRPSSTILLVGSRDAMRGLGPVALRGVRTVRDALPGWDGRVAIEVPGSVQRFARATGLAPSSARGLAAVTTSNQAETAGGPERVVLNERVYGPLGAVGQQIVMSHEMTHVAVGAASSATPLWLSEGYADYVALRRSDVPTRVLAAQIRSLVRREGPPPALPGPEEFDGANPDVGAWYESSWIAARLLAQTYGEDALNRFYRESDRDGGTDRAFGRLGTSERAFTERWRDELVALSR